MMNEKEALEAAIRAAQWSTCKKSRRGVVIWRRNGGLISSGWNQPAMGHCDGSAECRRDCNKICVHAEVYALREAARYGKGISHSEMLHVKVVKSRAVPSGPPSCWQCSREILGSGVRVMWLLHADASGAPFLKSYTVKEFHEATLRFCGLHPYGKPNAPIPPSSPPTP